MRYVPGPLQPPPGSSGVGVNLVVYTPTTPERPYALIVVVSEKWPNSIRGGSSGGGEGSGYRGGGGSGGGSNGGSSIGGRWSGAPRRSCHVGSREITFESGSAVLLFSLRDCQAASINVPPRWPSDADLAAVRLGFFSCSNLFITSKFHVILLPIIRYLFSLSWTIVSRSMRMAV
jgi:hypothetical protein